MVARKQIATCFSVKKKLLAGHNPPPLNHGFGVIIEYLLWHNIGMHIVLVVVDTIIVVLMI